MDLNNPKPFEQPDAGTFAATLIDIVELPGIQTRFGKKDRVRFVWVLGRLDNQPLTDSEGKPFRVVKSMNATMGEKGDLFKLLVQILNGPPPVMNKVEQLEQLVLGRSNMAYLAKAADPTNPQKIYTNIVGLAPLPPGVNPPQAPAGYIRDKFRPKQTAGPQPGQTTATYSTPPYVPPAPAAAPAPYVPPAAPAPNPAYPNYGYPTPAAPAPAQPGQPANVPGQPGRTMF